ncbi:hypothetical protein [Mucilaginibacter gotjawali]|uniref:Uncharacterized protein n=2 Tax=Mucilaginibacter gotjawali TaxID=1550579 RepID=A0A839SDD4_9SPHI|nr:hypothetical protein [Mucilaginibacter gotjawali]MBB3055588.1 hypothetical protein [Mucilaginibacter gotjawali]BAU53129.1 hypothetical protein MgSA37_01296 [Mucilaginibacter gotjawali]
MLKEQQFWTWFKENEAKYFFLNQINDDNERERLLDEFLEHLHIYCDHLFFEIGGHPNEKQDLIITAEGNADFFDRVEALVSQAPQLEYWNAIAFKPPIGNGIIEYNGIKLDPETMLFDPLSVNTSQKIGLRVHVDNFNPNRERDFLTAVYLLLDNILGEKPTALEIGYVDVKSMPPTLEKEELIEFTKLPRYIQWKKSKMNT